MYCDAEVRCLSVKYIMALNICVCVCVCVCVCIYIYREREREGGGGGVHVTEIIQSTLKENIERKISNIKTLRLLTAPKRPQY